MTQKKNLWAQYETNLSFEKEGVDFVVSDTESFRVKRYGGSNASKIAEANARFSKPYIALIKSKNMSQNDIVKIMAQVFVSCSVVDWKGITDKEGNPLEFNFENAVNLLCTLPDLLNSLMSYAENPENFKDEKQGDNEELGNS